MSGDQIAIGKARLKTFGLNAQGISRSSEARVPGRPTFKGMDYQLTGLGERITQIEAITYPLVTGGLDMIGWLINQHERQDVVNYIRLGSAYLGRNNGSVTIRSLEYDEDQLHPFTGIGRKVEVSFELVHLPDFVDRAGQAALQAWTGFINGR
jgi:phage protein U